MNFQHLVVAEGDQGLTVQSLKSCIPKEFICQPEPHRKFVGIGGPKIQPVPIVALELDTVALEETFCENYCTWQLPYEQFVQQYPHAFLR